MELEVTAELKSLCELILEEDQDLDEWREFGSSKDLEPQHFSGDFDKAENAFYFNYWGPDGSAYWILLSLDDVEAVANGVLATVALQPIESQGEAFLRTESEHQAKRQDAEMADAQGIIDACEFFEESQRRYGVGNSIGDDVSSVADTKPPSPPE